MMSLYQALFFTNFFDTFVFFIDNSCLIYLDFFYIKIYQEKHEKK